MCPLDFLATLLLPLLVLSQPHHSPAISHVDRTSLLARHETQIPEAAPSLHKRMFDQHSPRDEEEEMQQLGIHGSRQVSSRMMALGNDQHYQRPLREEHVEDVYLHSARSSLSRSSSSHSTSVDEEHGEGRDKVAPLSGLRWNPSKQVSMQLQRSGRQILETHVKKEDAECFKEGYGVVVPKRRWRIIAPERMTPVSVNSLPCTPYFLHGWFETLRCATFD